MKRAIQLMTGVLAVGLAAWASAGDLVETPGSEAGMSDERLARITGMTQRYVDEGKLAGVVTAVARDGKIVHFEAVGQRGAEDERPMTRDALFRIFSMSKPITAVAAMMLESVAKVLMWPTRRTTKGTLRQPRMKPAK